MHTHLQPWSLPLPVTSALLLVAVVYMRGWFRLRSAFPNMIPIGRVAAFMAGLFSVWIALASPLATLDHQLLTIHMAKHLLLMAVGAPLILWGSPVPPMLFGMPKWLNLDPLLGSRHLKWTGRCLSHPVLCWLSGTATVMLWHVPAMFQLALQSHGWHDVEHANFLAAGLLFWWPVVRPWPSGAIRQQWSVPLYLFFATLPCDILSGFLVFCGRVVYPSYLESSQLFHLSPVQDQEFAGALMWVAVTLIYSIPAAVITVQILSASTEHYGAKTERV